MATIYRIGTVELTRQAFTAFILGSTLSFFIVLAGLYVLRTKPALMGAILLIAVLMFGITCYWTYVINCTVVGKCQKLAWVLVVFASIPFVVWTARMSAALALRGSGSGSLKAKPRKTSS